MHCRKHSQSGNHTSLHYQIRPKEFVFFDKRTGAARFKVQAGADGKMPQDQAISLLAMNCLVRGQIPKDYTVMIAVGENLVDGLEYRTRKLIQSSMVNAPNMQLTQRQQEVLTGVLQNLANKEIAAKLNLSERAVKFHVSSLLRKFNVSGRAGLVRVAGDALFPREVTGREASPGPLVLDQSRTNPRASAWQANLRGFNLTERRAAKYSMRGQ